MGSGPSSEYECKIINRTCDLNDIPSHMITYNLCKTASKVGDIQKTANYIPQEHRSLEMIDILLRRDPYVLIHFDPCKRTKNICVFVLNKICKDKNQLYKIYDHTISINQLIEGIPIEHIDLAMIKKFCSSCFVSELYAHAIKTLELDAFIVAQQSFDISRIPLEQLTPELGARYVLRFYPYHVEKLSLIPLSCQTPELCVEMIKLGLKTIYDKNFNIIPNHMLNKEICIQFVLNEIKQFNKIPSKYHSTEMYEILVARGWGNHLFRSKHMTQDLIDKVVSGDKFRIHLVPHHLQTIGMCDRVFATNLRVAKFLNPDLLTKDYLVKKVETNELILEYLPQLKRDVLEELALELGLKVVPSIRRDFDLCVKCCEKNMKELRYVSLESQIPICAILGYPIGGVKCEAALVNHPPPYS